MKIITEGLYTGRNELEYNASYSNLTDANLETNKPNVLLHSCCGPCSTAVIERLAPSFNITVFFYNPNITDADEYYKRRDSQLKFLEKFNTEHHKEYFVDYLEGEYNPQCYLNLTSNMKNEPEGGLRCNICFRLRLERTAEVAKALGKDCFATTLTVSPHKNYDVISSIGNIISESLNIPYLDENFKKKGGFKRSIELSKKYNLYRQDYCGCDYSKRNKNI